MEHLKPIAEISRTNNRFTKGWYVYVLDYNGQRISELDVRYETKAQAVKALQEKHPEAVVLKKRDFWNERARRHQVFYA